MNRNLYFAKIKLIQFEVDDEGRKFIYVVFSKYERVVIDISHHTMLYQNLSLEEKILDKEENSICKAWRNNEETIDIEFDDKFYNRVKKILKFNIKNDLRRKEL